MTRDRVHFAKALGSLYVVPAETGCACCTPRR